MLIEADNQFVVNRNYRHASLTAFTNHLFADIFFHKDIVFFESNIVVSEKLFGHFTITASGCGVNYNFF